MQAQAMQDLGHRLRARICIALAEEINCPSLHREIHFMRTVHNWKPVETHVVNCFKCSTLEASEGMKVFRSRALARRVMEEAIAAFNRPQNGDESGIYRITRRQYPWPGVKQQGQRT